MGDFSAGQQLSDNLKQGALGVVLGQAGGWDGNFLRPAPCPAARSAAEGVALPSLQRK